jgi:glycerophosphoryl diester phosphodiesterase
LGSAGPALAELPLDELRSFDVGRIDPRRGLARRFAEQASVDGQRVPTLRETLALFAEEAQGRVRMDLELKTEPGSAASPEPEALCEEVLAELRRSTAEGLVRLRSFDFRNLELVRRWAPELPLIALTHERAPGLRRRREPSPWTGRSLSDYGGSIPRMVRSVGAVGWAPAMVDLRWRELREARGLGLTVHPWTVNSVRVMRGLVRLRVDSITTDYPNRLRRVLASEGYELPPGGYEPPRAEGA